jgi:hypothetical protein
VTALKVSFQSRQHEGLFGVKTEEGGNLVN